MNNFLFYFVCSVLLQFTLYLFVCLHKKYFTYIQNSISIRRKQKKRTASVELCGGGKYLNKCESIYQNSRWEEIQQSEVYHISPRGTKFSLYIHKKKLSRSMRNCGKSARAKQIYGMILIGCCFPTILKITLPFLPPHSIPSIETSFLGILWSIDSWYSFFFVLFIYIELFTWKRQKLAFK